MYRYFIVFFLFIGLGLNAQTNPYEYKNKLYQDLAYLSDDLLEGRMVGTEGEVLAAGYIAYRLKNLGLKPLTGYSSFLQEFTVRQRANPHATQDSPDDVIIKGYNVIAMIDNQAENTIVIGAHFDHLGWGEGRGSLHVGDKAIHNGADDNASGTAALIHLADVLSKKNSNNNFVFIAFSGEEQGLWGSNYFTKNPELDLEKVNYMINMDMVGRLNEERKLSVNGTGTSPEFDAALEDANEFNFKLVTTPSGLGASDHTSFYKKDIPVLHFFTGQHSDYHKPSDDIQFINFDGLLDIANYIELIIEKLDDKGKIEFTKTKDEQTETPRFTVSLGVMPDYLYDGRGMRIDAVREGKPAQKVNLKAGDIVIELGGKEIVDMMSYMKVLSEFKKGDKTSVTVQRGKETIKKEIEF